MGNEHINAKNIGIVVVSLFILGLFNCAEPDLSMTYAQRLNLNWDQGMNWRVQAKTWPERLEMPAERGDTVQTKTWYYRVKSTSERSTSTGKVLMTGRDKSFLLAFSEEYNLDAVKKVQDYVTENIVKTKQVREGDRLPSSSPLYGGHSGIESINLWYFPSMSGYEMYKWKRHTILSNQRSTGQWVEQKVIPANDGLKFELRNESRTERIEFLWETGEPWWTKAVWYKQKRVIAFLQTMDDS